MIDPILLEQYIEDSSMMMNDDSRQNLQNFLVRFFNQKPDKEYSELVRQDFVDMFSQLKILSTNSFESYKSKVGDFMKWMYENGHSTDQQLKEIRDVSYTDLSRRDYFDTYYFRDFDDLYDTMDKAFDGRGTEFDTFRAAAILVWFGIELKELPEMLKKDILEDECCVIHPVTKEKFPLSRLAVDFLAKYRDADNYDSSKFGGTVMVYVATQYLFRTYKNAHMTYKDLSYTSNVVNKLAEEIGKTFNWKTIYLSGIYYRIFQYEQEHGEISRYNYDVLKALFQKDDADLTPNRKRNLSQKYDEYLEFKAMKLS